MCKEDRWVSTSGGVNGGEEEELLPMCLFLQGMSISYEIYSRDVAWLGDYQNY